MAGLPAKVKTKFAEKNDIGDRGFVALDCEEQHLPLKIWAQTFELTAKI